MRAATTPFASKRARPHGLLLVLLVFSLLPTASWLRVLVAPVRNYCSLPPGAQRCRTDSAATRLRQWRSTAIIDSVVSDRVLPWRVCDFTRKTPSHLDFTLRRALAANSKRKQSETDKGEG